MYHNGHVFIMPIPNNRRLLILTKFINSKIIFMFHYVARGNGQEIRFTANSDIEAVNYATVNFDRTISWSINRIVDYTASVPVQVISEL